MEEDWVLEVYDRHDRAVNVTMEPGDMVLYESGSLMHGRPFALKGNYYANIFIHFEPTGEHLYDHKVDEGADDNFFPPYILEDSPEQQNWARRNPAGWKKHAPSAAAVGRPEGHVAAAYGDVERLAELAAENHRALHAKDENGWQPIHESVRGGHKKAVELLVKHGADVNAVTNHGAGVSPYNIAVRRWGEDHELSRYLLSLGAVNVGPEL